ncbi:HAD family hydrolase [Amycolatopsis sp. H20-H5]|uniref:HAD family hydrolase n=1 Tax=Amycolatopsis sp. H20-H5 TaxID=3046309 RepID=UPI002DBD1DD9|nr:HAD family hydrolase [Amycolatopsis sp. H20-H5]MEC3981718.1 HAD family hydrolase [Amycolatopsis sp. H20-H5]
MTTRALIFDFDGLLVDTEAAVLLAWQEAFAEHGTEFPLDVWHTVIGTQHTATTMFPLLRNHAGGLELEEFRLVLRARIGALLENEGPRPGVLDYLDAAADLGLTLAVASSSTGGWVSTHLRQQGLTDRFAAVLTGDLHPAKPRPDLYLAALDALGVTAAQALAFEDSPHGVSAAKAAGLRCVAVPNAITVALDLSHADLTLSSFEDKPLGELLRHFSGDTA